MSVQGTLLSGRSQSLSDISVVRWYNVNDKKNSIFPGKRQNSGFGGSYS